MSPIPADVDYGLLFMAINRVADIGDAILSRCIATIQFLGGPPLDSAPTSKKFNDCHALGAQCAIEAVGQLEGK